MDDELLAALKSVIKLPVKKPFSLDNTFILRSFFPLFSQSGISLEDKMRTAVEYIADAISRQAAFAQNKAEPSKRKTEPTESIRTRQNQAERSKIRQN